MNKNNASDYLPLVQALADGKTIQHCKVSGEAGSDYWQDCVAPTFGDKATRYRIKKDEKPKSWYRVCLTTHGAMAASSDKQEELIGNFPIFIRWLTDRIEYTLPEGDA